MEELKQSIQIHGLRLPIDLFPLRDPEPGETYGLISGWRRLMAFRTLLAETGDERYATIPAFVRSVGTGANAYIAMVEENEIRANLSHYERGRVAVMAVGHGAFDSVEDAVNALYQTGSKAKRSKIRSFAELHEELGDMLSFAADLSERQGLRLVAAMRQGYIRELRQVLATGQGVDAPSEWGLLEPVIEQAEATTSVQKPRRVARQAAPRGSDAGDGYYRLANGITIMRDSDSRGYYIRLEGSVVNFELVEEVMFEIKRLLEPV